MKHYNCSKKNSYIKNFYNNELYYTSFCIRRIKVEKYT